MTKLLNSVLFIATLALTATATAAETNTTPAAPIRLIVGFPPGGALDTLARAVAEQMSVSLQEPVLVENRPGASTRISIEAVKNSRPDGRTILLGSTPPFVIFPMTYSRLNYDVDKDFIPVAHLAYAPTVVSAGAQQPYRTVKEYAAWVKQNPTQTGFGLTSLGGALHFSILMLAKAIDAPLAAVSYKGGAPLATDIVGGHLPIGTDALASQLELHRAGRLRILAVSGKTRLKWLPEVPTLNESGITAFDHANASYGAYAPAGTPRAVVVRLEQAMIAAMKVPQVRERLDRLGLEASGLPGTELQNTMRTERAFWRPVVAASGFKSED